MVKFLILKFKVKDKLMQIILKVMKVINLCFINMYNKEINKKIFKSIFVKLLF